MQNIQKDKKMFSGVRDSRGKGSVQSAGRAYGKRIIAFIVCLFLILSDFITVAAAGGNGQSDNRTVKAGIFSFEGYHMKDEEGKLTGYGIEFLGLVSEYSHLNFQYTGYDNSWDDMLAMLENGEIDMVSSARRTAEREKKFAFSLPIGRNNTILSIRADNSQQRTSDYKTYDGMTVGQLTGSSQNQSLVEFAEEKGFSYRAKEYKDADDLAAALQAGKIDAILTSDLRKGENEKTLEVIGEDNFYVIVRKDDKELLNEINYAIEQMDQNEGDWKNVLHYRYYGPDYSPELTFTEREKAYIREVVSGKKKITITALGDREPYSYVENGKLKGILPDYFSDVMEVAGLPYEVVIPEDREDYYAIAETNGVDVVIDRLSSGTTMEEDAYSGFNTDVYMTTGVARVTRQDFTEDIKKVAASDSRNGNFVLKELSEDVEFIHYPNREAALQAVLDREADAAYVYAYAAQLFVNHDVTNSLYYSIVNDMNVEFQMYVRDSADHELITILNKCIQHMSGDTLNQLVLKYTSYTAGDMSLLQYMQAHPDMIVAAAMTVALIICIILVLYLRGRWNRKLLDATEQSNREMKEQEEVLAEALAQAQHANNAKTTFLNNMSHDIRTPMNAIIGFTSLAVTHIDNKTQVQDYLGKIMTSGNHLLSLINDVLDMSRIESGKVKIEEKEASLPEIMHDLKVIVQADVKAKQLEFYIDTLDVVNETIICDKLRLNQVLLNIMSNAMKYTKPGGMVSVRVIQTSEAQDGSAAYEFHIRDTGIGMSREFQQHVFEPFEREQTSTVSGIQGTGLGLAITKNIVDMMNGTITVDSEEGKGSEFTVTFHFQVADSHMKPQRLEYLADLRALVVDDDVNTCISVGKMLSAIGMHPDWTTLGKEAVIRTEFALEQNEPYSAYIIDWLMPDMNGIELVRRIRKVIGELTPIIILTAYDWSDIEEEAKEAGVTGFCSKPIFLSELRDVLAAPYQNMENVEGTEESGLNFDGRRILLVEDNELNQEIAQSILEGVGFLVDTADDGSAAVEQMKEMPADTYALILMDVQMPIMDGYQATRAIRALDDSVKAAIPIVAMTANAFEEDRKEAMDSGMDGYVAKPIDIEKLMQTMEDILKL